MNLPTLPADKANHALYGLGIFAVVALLLGPLGGLAGAVLAGAIKEAIDATGRGRVEVLDFVATAAGGVLGFACATLPMPATPIT